jgi:hypothetical protein
MMIEDDRKGNVVRSCIALFSRFYKNDASQLIKKYLSVRMEELPGTGYKIRRLRNFEIGRWKKSSEAIGEDERNS